jgi:hypothetical protein
MGYSILSPDPQYPSNRLIIFQRENLLGMIRCGFFFVQKNQGPHWARKLWETSIG